ncbi:MAG: hypothetical protein HZB79_05795 [Deltaproteobacteria bacterium]|nr:hypothetical protein [Deltaproteobacteria bacterium]
MFIGHYGIALAAKRADKNIPLGLLFFATQFADILFFLLILLGIESMSFAPGITDVSPLDFTYYPYSHSLAASVFWAGLFCIFFKIVPLKSDSNKNKIALIVGAVALSHFLLDLIVHRADLPLFGGGSYKIGLGLWNYVFASSFIELLIFFAGLWIYLKSTKGVSIAGRYGMVIFSAFVTIMWLTSLLAPTPSEFNIIGFVVFGLVFQLLVIGTVSWLDRERT